MERECRKIHCSSVFYCCTRHYPRAERPKAPLFSTVLRVRNLGGAELGVSRLQSVSAWLRHPRALPGKGPHISWLTCLGAGEQQTLQGLGTRQLLLIPEESIEQMSG